MHALLVVGSAAFSPTNVMLLENKNENHENEWDAHLGTIEIQLTNAFSTPVSSSDVLSYEYHNKACFDGFWVDAWLHDPFVCIEIDISLCRWKVAKGGQHTLDADSSKKMVW